MEKSTLKKGGIVLLGAMTLFGTGILSWADVTEQVNPPIEKEQPGWTVVNKGAIWALICFRDWPLVSQTQVGMRS